MGLGSSGLTRRAAVERTGIPESLKMSLLIRINQSELLHKWEVNVSYVKPIRRTGHSICSSS